MLIRMGRHRHVASRAGFNLLLALVLGFTGVLGAGERGHIGRRSEISWNDIPACWHHSLATTRATDRSREGCELGTDEVAYAEAGGFIFQRNPTRRVFENCAPVSARTPDPFSAGGGLVRQKLSHLDEKTLQPRRPKRQPTRLFPDALYTTSP